MGYRDSALRTPNIDKLATNGVIFNDFNSFKVGLAQSARFERWNQQHSSALVTRWEYIYIYVRGVQICSPSRSSFMTGRYPYHIGQQTNMNLNPSDSAACGINLNYTFIPEILRKQQNYSTHAIGKWHLVSSHICAHALHLYLALYGSLLIGKRRRATLKRNTLQLTVGSTRSWDTTRLPKRILHT